MNIIDTSTFNWSRAKKTKAIRAISIAAAVHPEIIKYLNLETIEANEPLESINFLCIATTGEAWQQAAKNFFKKYKVVNVDLDGFLVAEPLPENEVEFVIAEQDGYIVGKWGETIDGVKNLQRVRVGDTIARQTYEHEDQWVVNRTLWNGTYTVL